MKKVRITVMKIAKYQDLIDKYYDNRVGAMLYCFYDSDTYVMYSSIGASGLEQLVYPDGSPKIYKP